MLYRPGHILRISESHGRLGLRRLKQRPEPTVKAFDATLDGFQLEGKHVARIAECAKSKQWQRACQIFAAMPTMNFHPSTNAYNTAIGACEKSGQWQYALKLFEAMPCAKVRHDITSYNALMSACGRAGLWQHAL